MSNYNYIRHLNAFFSFVRSDNRLTSFHVSLYLALFQYWNFNRFNNPFPVYRENLMQINKIGSKNTYHKCMKHLHHTEYIIYHPQTSKFQPVKISVKRLDGQEPKPSPKQLDLFNQNSPSPHGEGQGMRCPKNDTDSVPNLTSRSIDFDTGTVPNLGHSIKQNNKQENSVSNTPTKIFESNEGIKEKQNRQAGVSNSVITNQFVTLNEVEEFFKQNKYPVKEGHKFFYYNQGKNWMLTDKIPIYDWKALAHKWMLNTKDPDHRNSAPDSNKDIQYLNERFLDGEKISKYIVADYCNHLQLEITDAIRQEARQRRINQVTGSNEHLESQLWLAYTGAFNDPSLIEKDMPNLQSLTKRLAVLKYFQNLQQSNQLTIPKTENNEH